MSSNNQSLPIKVVLDRILVTSNWEALFPLSIVQVLTRIGSDHNPLLVDSRDNVNWCSRIFRFEPSWLTHDGFHDWVVNKWLHRTDSYILDYWHKVSGCLRKVLKGWGANVGSEQRKHKQNLLLNINFWDEEAEKRDLSAQEWAMRYSYEELLLEIYKEEEIFFGRDEEVKNGS